MAMNETQQRALAAQAIKAWGDAALVAPFSVGYPGLQLADGYAVMNHLHQHRVQLGWAPVGRKIGFTNTTIWQRYGVHHPIWGWVYDRTLLPAPTSHSEGYTCALGGLLQPRIEPEIVLCFDRTPPASDDPHELWSAVAWVAHGFELVQSHYPEWRFSAADAVVFGALHGCLMVGPRVPAQALASRPEDAVAALAGLQITLQRHGDQGWEDCDQGRGSNVLGNPLLAVAHLQRQLAREGGPLIQAGEVVTTGTVTDAHAVAPGQSWRTQVRGLGLPGLQVRFSDAVATGPGHRS